MSESDLIVEDLKSLFVETRIDPRIEQALPMLARIQKEAQAMKEAEIFESLANRIVEGTWALPETPEQQAELKMLMSQPLIAGADGMNATEQLYGLVGDDELFDIIGEIAVDPDANIWDDERVQNRLEELGVYMVTPAEPAQADQTPPVAESRPEDLPGIDYDRPGDVKRKQPSDEHNPYPYSKEEDDDYFREIFRKKREAAKQQGMAEGNMDGKVADIKGQIAELEAEQEQNEFGSYAYDTVDGELQYLYAKLDKAEKGVAEGDNLGTFESTLDTMRKAAGVPILKAALLSAGGAAYDKFTESRLMDSAGETLQHILNRFKHEVRNFEADGDLDDDLYHALYDYYSDNGEMPYGTMKARTGDPYNWISDRLAQELGINEGAAVDAYMAGKSPALAHFADQLDKSSDVKEGSCNMTMEGEYCPEHGLAECGGMYEMGTVAGGIAPVIGEGDAVLARIKSLALLK